LEQLVVLEVIRDVRKMGVIRHTAQWSRSSRHGLYS